MRVEVLSLFPEWVAQLVTVGMPRVAVECGALEFAVRNYRDFSDNRWRRVDERPFGGGPGMVMQAEPLAQTIAAARQTMAADALVVGMSPQGEPLSQALVERLAQRDGLILVCGRYEGFDERVTEHFDFEVSIGDYVLSGGELAAMVIVDAVARLLPGVLGDAESACTESFTSELLDHPQYSRPVNWRGQAVPEVLMSGDHAKIARWRLKQALGRTWLRRPDLLDVGQLSAEQCELLREFIAEQRV